MVHEATPRIARKRELKSEAILDAANAVLVREGLDGLTVARVAAEMDLVPAALYRYYDSKDALLAGLQRRAVIRIGDVIQRALGRARTFSSEGLSCLTRLLVMAEAYAALPAEAPQAWHLVSLMLAEPKPLLSPEQAARTAPLLAELVMELREILERAVASRALARGGLAERLLAYWAAVHGAAALVKIRLWVPQLADSRTVALDAVTALLRGWGADPKLLAKARKEAMR